MTTYNVSIFRNSAPNAPRRKHGTLPIRGRKDGKRMHLFWIGPIFVLATPYGGRG